MKVLKKIKISVTIIALCLFGFANLFAQSKIGLKLPAIETPTISSFQIINPDFGKTAVDLDKSFYLDTYFRPATFNSPFTDKVLNTFSMINNVHHSTMPFFCKIEFQMEQASGFPVKFRLGDVNLVDRLESKKDWELGN